MLRVDHVPRRYRHDQVKAERLFFVCKNVMYHKTGKLSSRQMKTETVFVFMLANEQARPIFCEGKGGEIVDVVVE